MNETIAAQLRTNRELLEYDRTHGETDQPWERDAVFQLLGIGSVLTLSERGRIASETAA